MKNNGKGIDSTVMDELRRIIERSGGSSPVPLESLADALEMRSHEGSYDYMLLAITLCDMAHAGIVKLHYSTDDIYITLK